VSVYSLSFAAGLEPSKVISVSDWSDNHRILSRKSSSEPGRWRTDRVPYLRAIMDCLSLFEPCKKVVIQKASQVGVSEAVVNAIGHTIELNPCPILVIYPVEALAKKMSRLRFDTMVDESPRLRDLVAASKGRDSKNTALEKEFTGGNITFGGAASPNALSSVSARVVALDEVDRMPLDVSSEGDPIFLATQRATSFSRHKIVMLSTPTRAKTSIICSEFEKSNQQKYHVPCGKCGLMQELLIENFRYEAGDSECVDAWFECGNCKARIDEIEKPIFLPKGAWIETQKSPIIGFHISQFYLPIGWKSWRAIGYEHSIALKDKEKLIAFTNTVLGLAWQESVEKPDPELVYARREKYPIGKIPTGVLFLTAGVDVQGNRLEAHIVGWTRDKRSYTIDYRILYGDTDNDAVWSALGEVLDRLYDSVDGSFRLPIQVGAVDTGYRTERVYGFVRSRMSQESIMAVKGDDRLMVPVGRPSITEVDSKGRSFKRGIHLWPVGVNRLKLDLYDRLQLRQNVETGEYPAHYCHFPELELEFFKQLTAESQKVKVSRNGRRSSIWVKDYERNEALDTWIYARAAACRVGLDRFDEKEWDKIEFSLSSPASSHEPITQKSNINEKTIKIRRKSDSGYW
jgi:phage terminase large subunit GpA-like protein